MASCCHPTVIDKINRANELMTQLRALILPWGPIDSSSELARDLFDETLRVLTAASSELQPSFCPPTALQVGLGHPEGEQRMKASSKKRSSLGKRSQRDDERRRKMNFYIIVTSVPHVDGHQWRKYGQKQIIKAAFLRHYYKCTHYKDQGCQAKKTVQQLTDNDDPPKFTVSYIMQHSCKTFQTSSMPVTLDMEHKFIRSQEESSYGSIALNCPPAVPETSTATRGGLEEFSTDIDCTFDMWDEGEGQVMDGEEWDRLWGFVTMQPTLSTL